MDLPKAVETLSMLRSQMAYEELIEAKKTIVKFQESLDDLINLVENLEIKESVNISSINENWSKVRDNILRSFE